MTAGALLWITLLVGCDNFPQVQEADTIEAYEEYLAANPNSRWQLQAESRLEELYLEKARQEKTLLAYDAYLEKYPEGDLLATARQEREEFLWAWARGVNTAEGWQKYLDEYPRADKKKKTHARRMIAVHEYLPNIEVGEVEIAKVNMAENPDGPLDGWGFTAEVTNNGDAAIADLRLTVQYLSKEGGVLEENQWPVVAEAWGIPMEEEKKVPMAPGETRTWFWSDGTMPDKWDERARVYVSKIEKAKADRK